MHFAMTDQAPTWHWGIFFVRPREKIMKKFKYPLVFFSGFVLAIFVCALFAFTDTGSKNFTESNSKNFANKASNENKWYAPALPEQLSFAGEQVPLHRWDVREKFDKEYFKIYYEQGNILYLLKLAERNFPIISEILKANGVPDDFKYVCVAESNMQGWAVSKAGAVGYWQFMSATAPGYGLELNSLVDERRHLEKATDAACKYFKQAYNKFGNWTAAAASLNCGMGGYNKQATFQKTTKYYDLFLPEETNKYIFRIVSFKHVMENASDLGFIIDEKEKYQDIPVENITVTSSIANLSDFAEKHGTNYKVLRMMNPWLTGRSLTVGGGRKYIIKVPGRQE